MNKKQKLLLYIQVNEIDGALDFTVDPAIPAVVKDGVWIYEFEHTVGTNTKIKVDLKGRQGNQSHIIIKEVQLDGQTLNNLDRWSRYVVYETGQTESTFGYMGKPGCYVLTIHQNALVHNYMSYFLSSCQGV